MRLGRYELLSRLATGGMGEVFLARRRGPGDIEKRVVIKRIRRDLSGDPRFVEMFLREARLSMTLSHKNIAAVFDFGRAGPELFLAMEHVDGRDLGRALRAAKARAGTGLSPTAVAHIGIEVCRALDYAHHSSKGEPIIHRDLSPKNLLVSFAGEIVVADFGLAIAAGEKLEKAGVRGTPAYLSPEQARGEAVDVRSDLFSLGLVLREVLAGEPAYAGDKPLDLIELAKAANIAPLPDEVPAALRAAIEKATAKDADDRFATSREMQLALDEFLVAGRAAGAAPPGLEIAAWLAELFEGSVAGDDEPIGKDGAVRDAVTFLDDGPDAVALGARELQSIASLAATIGDSDATTRSDGSAKGVAGSRLVVALLAAALLAVTVGGVSLARRLASSETSNAVTAAAADARTPPVDAASADVARAVDAGAIDAPIDARAAVARTGSVRVHSRPWARVVVLRTGKSCNETPCRFTLPVGTYTLQLSNPITGVGATRRVTIVADSTIDITVDLPRPR